MKNKKELFYILLILFFLSYILFHTKVLSYSIINATRLFFNKVFPFLFTMIIINELLLKNNIIYYINKIFKKNGIKYYIILMSMLSGSPTSVYLIKSLLNSKVLNAKDANKMLLCSHFCNPIFLITMLNNIFDKKATIIIIAAHYLPNIIMSFFIKIDTKDIYINDKYNNIINNAINTSLLVLGTLTIYITISNIIFEIVNLSNLHTILLKGIIEVTQGLNLINTLAIKKECQMLIAILFINFGGLSIHNQIRSIMNDTPLKYKYYLFGRLISLI